jgi:hypothetical protein
MRNVNVKCIDGIGLLGRFGVRLLVPAFSVRDRHPSSCLLVSRSSLLLPFTLLFAPLRLHRLDEIAKRFPKVLCLLSPQTLNQLVGDIRRALHLRQEVITEEINRFLTPSLEGISKKHGDFE